MGPLLPEISCMRISPTARCVLADEAGLLSDCNHQFSSKRAGSPRSVHNAQCAAAGKPRAAWELYLRQGVSDKSLLLLQLIANQCYQQVSQDTWNNADSLQVWRSCVSGSSLRLADRVTHRPIMA